MVTTADSPAKDRYRTDSHTEQVCGVGLGEKLTVWIGREEVTGTLYAVPAVEDGTPVTIHVVVVGVGRMIIPWHSILKIKPHDSV